MRQTQKFLSWLAVISLGITLFIDAGRAAATQLDTAFGENGFISKDFLQGDDEIFALAPQADGKIVVVGQYYNGAVKNIAVARYLPSGELDKEFNNDGIFTQSIGTGDSVARCLAIQSDGKIVVAGSTTGGEHNIVVLRLTKDGFEDNAFADNGKLLLPITAGETNAYAVKTTLEGAILVAGTVTKADAGTYGIVVKLTGDGQYAKDFGDAGVSLIKYDYDVALKSIVVKTDGEIVTAGAIATSGVAKAGLLWLDKNGKVDESFGEKGQAIISLEGSGSTINDVTLDSTGRLLVAGNVNNGSNLETFVGRLQKDGAIDTTFATAGIYHNSSTAENVGQAVTLQADGTILVAGFVATTKGKDAYLLTLVEKTISSPSATPLPSETPLPSAIASPSATSSTSDTISASYVTADLAGTDDVGNTLAVLADGSIFVGGSTVMSGNKDFALLRFIGGEKQSALTGGTTATGQGVSTAGYTIITKEATAITRVGAFSGGIITDDGNITCKESCVNCNASISTTSSTAATTVTGTTPAATSPTTTVTGTTPAATSSTNCYDSCYSACKLPTVTLRGAVYGIKSNPVYDTKSNQDSSTDTTTPSTTTVSATTTTTSTSTSGTGTTTTTGSTTTIFPKSGTFVYTTVRSGQTEDGKGTGSYDSDIQEITPNTQYYVRAYAVLSDDTVIYGNEVTFKTNDACFIATAAFGSILDGHVTILREFRDRVLLVSALGQHFVGLYYGFSPGVADFISHHEALRAVVRVFLIPLVLLAYLILKTGAVTKICVLTAIVCVLAVISKKNLKTQVTSV